MGDEITRSSRSTNRNHGENHRPLKQQLASLRFYDLRQDCPTYAGILLFADQPTYFLPGAYVQFVRYAGSDLASEVIDEKRAISDLRSMLQMLDLLLDVNLRQHPVAVSTLREKMVYDYPRLAIRELLLNAVVHRNYQSNSPIRCYWFADHIRIDSPGGLYGEVSPENFPNMVDYRNPILAEATRIFGYTNRFGQGIARTFRALELNGNPPPEFTFTPHSVSVLIRASSTANQE